MKKLYLIMDGIAVLSAVYLCASYWHGNHAAAQGWGTCGVWALAAFCQRIGEER